MSKKKAIKIATASAIALTGAVAVAQPQAEAATNSVDKAITKATTQVNKAFNLYYNTTKKSKKLPSGSAIRKEVKLAEQYYAAAEAEIAKKGGSKSQKAAYTKKLEESKTSLNRAKKYVAAVSVTLKASRTAFADAVEVGTQSKVLSSKKALDAKIATFEKAVAKVYGSDARRLLTKTYTTPAKAEAASVDTELKVYAAYKEIESKKLITTDLKLAGEKIESVKAEVEELKAKDTKLAKNILKAVEKNNKAYEAAQVPAVESVSAINAKTLEVKFDKAVEVTAADFSVAKGSVKSNIANVTIAEDKKSAQIELTSKLTKGDYTVTVKQADKDALTGTASVEDEKVAGIQILSDNAVLAAGATPSTATVGVKVTNQYGEDVTKLNSNLTITVSGAATGATLNTDGTLTLTGIANTAKVGDSVTITLVHGATATTTTKTVKLSSATVASTVEVGALYNKDGKTLSQDTDLSADKFYLPITVKDQYGKEITSASKANSELLITNTNSAVATFADENEIKEVTINGKDVLALQVSSINLAGTTNVLAISKANGTSSQGTVTVKEGVKIASATLSAPTELVTANKDTYFPLSVVDSEGKEVTTKKALDAINDAVTPTGGTIVEVDGKGLFVKVAAANVVANSPLTVVVNTSTGKVSTQTVVPRAEAVATVVTGISADKATALRQGKSVTIANTDLVIEDQYGQVIKSDDTDDVLFTVKASDDTPFTVTPAENKKSVTITAKSNYAGSKTSDKLEFKLLDGSSNAIEASTFTKTFTVVSDETFASYKVEDVKPVYVDSTNSYTIGSDYQLAFVVKATTKSGEVVTLDSGEDYSVTGGFTVSGNKITAANIADADFADKATTVTKKVTITINATGEELTKEVTFSKEAPKAAKVELALDGTTAAATKYDLVTKESVSTAVNADTLEDLLDIIVTDQYGVKVLADNPAEGETGIDSITFTKVSGKATFTGNGTSVAKVTTAEKDAVVSTTINVGGQKATVQLTFSAAVVDAP
ncbi:hypothetical protein [Peribacillus sp. Hz7]|uniref:hypothetical protein n=1 Tax=Peribacillus sp. Hz7 TaxID=3344873 RepID=UPI0035C9BC97